MKNYILILFLATAFLFNSCIHDFEEGADISLRSVERRIEGKWRIKGVWVDGIDSTTYPPYSQYTQKDSLVLEFVYKEQYGSEKINYLISSEGQPLIREATWSYRKEIIELFNEIYGFNHIFFQSHSASYWRIICCWHSRLVLDLDRYYPGNSDIKTFKKMRILLIPA